jgi:hypothetical protein
MRLESPLPLFRCTVPCDKNHTATMQRGGRDRQSTTPPTSGRSTGAGYHRPIFLKRKVATAPPDEQPSAPQSATSSGALLHSSTIAALGARSSRLISFLSCRRGTFQMCPKLPDAFHAGGGPTRRASAPPQIFWTLSNSATQKGSLAEIVRGRRSASASPAPLSRLQQ